MRSIILPLVDGRTERVDFHPYVPVGRACDELSKIGPLLDDSSFEEILQVLRGKRWAFLSVAGNVGDEMINEGTRQLFDRNKIDAFGFSNSIPDWADGLLLCGGGNVGSMWNFRGIREPLYAQAIERKIPIVLLPQSIFDSSEKIPGEATVFAREVASLAFYPESRLAPDMSFALSGQMFLPAPVRKRGVFLRSDRESVIGCPKGSDPVRFVRSWREYIRLAAENEEVVTDRLHFAIAAIMAKRTLVFVKNKYHKNESMWKTWLSKMK